MAIIEIIALHACMPIVLIGLFDHHSCFMCLWRIMNADAFIYELENMTLNL